MPIFGIVDISASNITYIDGESNETVWPGKVNIGVILLLLA